MTTEFSPTFSVVGNAACAMCGQLVKVMRVRWPDASTVDTRFCGRCDGLVPK